METTDVAPCGADDDSDPTVPTDIKIVTLFRIICYLLRVGVIIDSN